MKTNQTAYSVDVSDSRIREILDACDQSFEELEFIPVSERLTSSNGFFVKCVALSIDIRGSSKPPGADEQSVWAKIFRAYLSECSAILNHDENCREVFITGCRVTGIFETKKQNAVSQAFFRAGQLNTLLALLNWRLEQHGHTPIQCGIGIDYGRALMLKAGFKGSSFDEVVWTGEVVNNSFDLCHTGNRGFRKVIQSSPVIYDHIREDYKQLLSPVFDATCDAFEPVAFEGDLVAMAMNDEIEGAKQAGCSELFRGSSDQEKTQTTQDGFWLKSAPRRRGLFGF